MAGHNSIYTVISLFGRACDFRQAVLRPQNIVQNHGDKAIDGAAGRKSGVASKRLGTILIGLAGTAAEMTCMTTNYQDVFDHANDAIFIHDEDSGAILDANRMAANLTGYSVAQARQ
jgi:PAS domain-containing protein